MSSFILTDVKKIYKTYGQALKEARKMHSMNQGSLADKLGVNQSEVSRWERQGIVPLDHTKEKIQGVLNVIIAPVKNGWIVEDQDSHSQEAFRCV